MEMNEGTIICIILVAALGGFVMGGLFGIRFTQKYFKQSLSSLPNMFVHEWLNTMGKSMFK